VAHAQTSKVIEPLRKEVTTSGHEGDDTEVAEANVYNELYYLERSEVFLPPDARTYGNFEIIVVIKTCTNKLREIGTHWTVLLALS